jgi:hypothetical protein
MSQVHNGRILLIKSTLRRAGSLHKAGQEVPPLQLCEELPPLLCYNVQLANDPSDLCKPPLLSSGFMTKRTGLRKSDYIPLLSFNKASV